MSEVLPGETNNVTEKVVAFIQRRWETGVSLIRNHKGLVVSVAILTGLGALTVKDMYNQAEPFIERANAIDDSWQ